VGRRHGKGGGDSLHHGHMCKTSAENLSILFLFRVTGCKEGWEEHALRRVSISVTLERLSPSRPEHEHVEARRVLPNQRWIEGIGACGQ
jgi:hypothetical protein